MRVQSSGLSTGELITASLKPLHILLEIHRVHIKVLHDARVAAAVGAAAVG